MRKRLRRKKLKQWLASEEPRLAAKDQARDYWNFLISQKVVVLLRPFDAGYGVTIEQIGDNFVQGEPSEPTGPPRPFKRPQSDARPLSHPKAVLPS